MHVHELVAKGLDEDALPDLGGQMLEECAPGRRRGDWRGDHGRGRRGRQRWHCVYGLLSPGVIAQEDSVAEAAQRVAERSHAVQICGRKIGIP